MIPWIAARLASLSLTISWSLLKLTPIDSVMPSNHLILCHPLLLLQSFPTPGSTNYQLTNKIKQYVISFVWLLSDRKTWKGCYNSSMPWHWEQDKVKSHKPWGLHMRHFSFLINILGCLCARFLLISSVLNKCIFTIFLVFSFIHGGLAHQRCMLWVLDEFPPVLKFYFPGKAKRSRKNRRLKVQKEEGIFSPSEK